MKKVIAIIMVTTFMPLAAQNSNPLLKEWSGPYNGLPAFNEYKVSDFKPALEIAMQEKLNEIDKIANNKKPATFVNTIVAMEHAGKKLTRVLAVYGIYSSNMNSPEFEPVETEFEPKLASLSDKIVQNSKLFKRIQSVYNSKAKSKLTKEQQRLIWVQYDYFVRQGAKLDQKTKSKVGKINQKLAGLFTKFRQNLLSEENNKFRELKNE